MNGFPGKFIVIDGTDGSGKTTQLSLLKSRLEEAGHIVALADFPQYNTKSAGLVEEYLSGKYGNAKEINAYKASIFYAVDRFDASAKIRKWLSEGKIVLANRYTSANMGHQGCKIANPLERRVFFNWLMDLEYKIFEIPRPDLTIILHLDPVIAQQRTKERAREDWNGKKNDIHEEDIEHLKNAANVYEEIANSFPDYELISCIKNGHVLDREEINLLVWNVARRIIVTEEKKSTNWQPISHLLGANQHIVENREIIFATSKNPATTNSTNLSDVTPALEQGLKIETEQQPIKSNEQTITPLQLAVERLSPEVKLPHRAHIGDAAFDIYSSDYYSILPYGQATVATGLKLAIPKGYAGLIWDKSGLATQGITTLGGVIDSSYRGELKIIIKNLSEDDYNIVPGQKIAQLLIQKIEEPEIHETSLTDSTERQANGFGSTGNF